MKNKMTEARTHFSPEIAIGSHNQQTLMSNFRKYNSSLDFQSRVKITPQSDSSNKGAING